MTKINSLLFVMFSAAVLCPGSTPVPFSRQIFIVDKMSEVAGLSSPEAGLAVLKCFAEAKPEDIDPSVLSLAGLNLKPSDIQQLKDPAVRAHALYRIGGTGLPGAVAFLARLKPGDLGQDASGQIDVAIALSYRQALLAQEKDPQHRVDFLKAALRERSIRVANGAITLWAIDQLCDDGQMTSLPEIRIAFRALYSGSYGEDEIRFCEARIRILNNDPDRGQALATVLRLSSVREDLPLIEWATRQLELLHSPVADRTLAQFAAEIDSLPDASPVRLNLSGVRERVLRNQRLVVDKSK
jgi:hypothetical protein